MHTQEPPSLRPDLTAPARLARADDGITFDRIFGSLRRHLRLILTVVVLGTGLAALAGYQITPRYTATAAVLVDPTHSGLLDVLNQGGGDRAADPAVIETQIQVITSRSHIGRLMEDLSLYDDPQFQPPVADDGGGLVIKLPEPLASLASHLPDTWLFAAGLAEDGLTPVEAAQPAVVNYAAVDRFKRDLEVEQVSQSSVITISYTSTEPEKAARLANAVADAYAASRVEGRRGAVGRAAGWLEKRVADLEEAVRESERAVAEFRVAHGLGADFGATFGDQRLTDLKQQLITIRAEQIAKQAKLDRISSAGRAQQGGAVPALAQELNSPLIVELRSQEAALQRERAELNQTYGALHPRMIDLRAALTEIQTKIGYEIDRGIRDLRDELMVLRSRERAIQEEIEKLKRESQTDRFNEVRLRELERGAETNRQSYEAALGHLKSAQQQEQVLAPDVRVISAAVPPPEPSTPGPGVFAMVGGTASLMLGAFLALLVERLDRRVRSAAGLERELGLSVLGLTPHLPILTARRRPDHYIVDRPFSGYAESTRLIGAALHMFENSTAATPSEAGAVLPLSERRATGRVLLVTSALPEEGKTTLSISLAATAARSGLRVLLIDLDLRRPALEQRLTGRITGGLGLVDYLDGSLPRGKLVQREPRTGVDYVAVGRRPRNPLEVLQSPKLRHLIEAARLEYDQIILDCAPLLAVTDTRIAVRLADRVVLATRWRRTDMEAVAEAARALLDVGGQLAGCVLAAVNMRQYKLYANDAGSYYGYCRRYYLNN